MLFSFVFVFRNRIAPYAKCAIVTPLLMTEEGGDGYQIAGQICSFIEEMQEKYRLDDYHLLSVSHTKL